MPKRAAGVHPRKGSNVYQWRIKVPLDLAPLYPGKQWAYRRSLGTTDLREANLKASRLNAEWQETFARQRKGSSVIDKLTPDHGRAIAHEALKTLLADEKIRVTNVGRVDRKVMVRTIRDPAARTCPSFVLRTAYDSMGNRPSKSSKTWGFTPSVSANLQMFIRAKLR